MKPIKDFVFVFIQFLLIALIFFLPSKPEALGQVFRYYGLFFVFFGFVYCVVALLQLNKNLSPFPTPKIDGVLITTGLYSIVRHPIYLGLIIFFVGYSVYVASPIKLGLSVLLAILFEFKASYEEGLLEEKYKDYGEYKVHTGKIFPKIFGRNTMPK